MLNPSQLPPQVQQMIFLAEVNKNGNLQLQEAGMSLIHQFLLGQMHLIVFEDFYQKGYYVSSKISRCEIKNNKSDNCLLIRPSNIIDPRTRKNLFFAQIIANNNVAKFKLHVFASLISSVQLVIVQTTSNSSFLAEVDKRVIVQDYQRQMTSQSRGKKTASLICVSPIHQQNPQYFVDSTEGTLKKFRDQNILKQVLNSYSGVKGIQCCQSSLVNPSYAFIDKFMQQIDLASMNPRENNELMYGPILAKYMENLCLQINNNQDGKIYVTKAQNQIMIDQGYDAYMAAVERFHKTSLTLINSNSKPDDNQLKQMLDSAKVRALQQFYSRGGSSNEYRKLLDDYINNKSRDINDLYSEQTWNNNLKILQSQSNAVVSKISSSKVKDPNIIMGYINEMSKKYSQKARGPSKYQILNEYLKVFTPIALEPDPVRQNKLRQEQRRNQELQARLNQLRKVKSGGCCSQCSIM